MPLSPAQPQEQVQPFGPGVGEYFEAVLSGTFGGRGRGKSKITNPGSLSNLITMWRHNMVAISKVGNFRTRLSLSEILSDLIRCKLVRYPWFYSTRPRSFTCLKMADVYYAYWSKFPSQSKASIRFLFRDQVCFSTSLFNLQSNQVKRSRH